MRIRTFFALAAIVFAALAASACGESDEEKAQDRICEARAGISSEVEKLGEITPATVTADGVRNSVESIQSDLKEISEARNDVSDENREQLEAANAAFTASVREVGANVLRSLSAEDAEAQLKAAAETLAASYRSTLGAYDCS